jgi:predicted DNA-binding protein YlxM (UPF0122 family)
MAYLKNSIIDFTRQKVSDYNISDYNSISFNNIQDFIKELDNNMFSWHQLQNNSNLEKVALDIYGNADYWDILLIINRRNPLFEFPYDFDTLSSMATEKAEKYVNTVFGVDLSAAVLEKMTESYKEKNVVNNEIYRVIKIINPSRIQEFLQLGYEKGLFK